MQAQQKTFKAFSMPHWITSKQVYFLSRANLKHSLQKVVSWRDELGKQKDRWRKANESGTPACTRKWMRRTSKWYDHSTSILLWRRPINKFYIRVHCTLAVDLNSLISSHRRLHHFFLPPWWETLWLLTREKEKNIERI